LKAENYLRDYGKTRRMEGVAGTWPTGQLVVGVALGSHTLLKLAVVVVWALPSPSKIKPAPPRGFVWSIECIFNDHGTGPFAELVGMATSFPFPLLGE
jgi:hypothetical protein